MSDLLDLIMTPRKRPVPPPVIRPLIELLSLPTPYDWDERQTFEEEVRIAEQNFRAAHPRGLTKEELNVDLTTQSNLHEVMAAKLCAKPRVARYFENRHSIGDWYNKGESKPLDVLTLAKWLADKGHQLDMFELAPFCTFAEIARFSHEQHISGPLSDVINNHPIHMFVRKISLSAWHWGSDSLAWDMLVRFHRMMMNFDLGLPGFDVTFDHSHSWMNQRGWAEYTGKFQRKESDPKTKPWLDGELGFIISFAGEHVMTVGVSPVAKGLLVNQIQLAKKKGNRWLYKLPKPHFEFVLDRLHSACESEGIDMYLVTGESLSTVIKSLYKDLPFNNDAGDHICRLYNQPLASLTRSEEVLKVNGHIYRKVGRAALENEV